MAQFLDEATVEVRSGDGGNGMIAWRRAKYEPMGGPAGGNGGRGGSVYIQSTRHLSTLIDFRFKNKYKADNGDKGGIANRFGHAAPDLVIKVPLGTVVWDKQENIAIADLLEEGDRVLVAEGGRGGRGNGVLASPTHRAPHFCEPGEPGIERTLKLELKLLADVGLLGCPNAGKSTLLSVMSAARPKIADYPFTTLEPQLGVVRFGTGASYVMADIPGLITGAHQGVGLGHDFLRHIERTGILVHLVDMSVNPEEDIAVIEEELRLFDEKLTKRKRIIVLNKLDLVGDQLAADLQKQVQAMRPNHAVLVISAAAHKNLDQLGKVIYENLVEARNQAHNAKSVEISEDLKASNHGDGSFVVSRFKKQIFIEGDRVIRLAQVTDAKSPESVHHFMHIMRAMGVIEALYKENVKSGEEVVIGDLTFTYGENLF